jgi:hypothetical protein
MGAVENLLNELRCVEHQLRGVESSLLARPRLEESVELRKRQVELLRRAVSLDGALLDQYDLMADDLRMAHVAEQLGHHRALAGRASSALRASRRDLRRSAHPRHSLFSRHAPGIPALPLDRTDH